VTANGTRVYVFLPANLAQQLIRAEQRVADLSYGAWKISGVRRLPELLLLSATEQSCWDDFESKNFGKGEDAATKLGQVTAPLAPEILNQVIPETTGSE